MIPMTEIRTAIVSNLTEWLGCPVIRTNQNEMMPPYPYCTYTITTAMSANNGTYGVHDDDTKTKDFRQIWSFSALSKDYAECMEIAVKAHEWLDEVGTLKLYDSSVYVLSVGSISDRSNILNAEYEYVLGFDFDINIKVLYPLMNILMWDILN